MDDLYSQKENHRARYRELRNNLSPEQVAQASADLCSCLAEWDVLLLAKRVLTYLAFDNEPDLSALFDSPRAAQIIWAVPRIAEQDLVAQRYDPNRLLRHPFGMMEPEVGTPTVDPAHLDLALVPGIAFDQEGGRLGFGGGFYDRFLSTTSAVRVGIVHECCLAAHVPCTDTDLRMDWIATPSELIECTRPGRNS